MFKAALRPGLECLRSMLKGGAGSNVTLNLGQFPEMRFYPHISFSEIDLQLNATFDSTPPFMQSPIRRILVSQEIFEPFLGVST